FLRIQIFLKEKIFWDTENIYISHNVIFKYFNWKTSKLTLSSKKFNLSCNSIFSKRIINITNCGKDILHARRSVSSFTRLFSGRRTGCTRLGQQVCLERFLWKFV